MTTHQIHREVYGKALFLLLLLLAAILLLGGCNRVEGGQGTEDPVARGKAAFETYCVSCHGPNGTGNGPVSPYLTVKPTNLTTLASSNNGVFPSERVVRSIDGRDTVRTHGTRAMPVWGHIWSEKNGKPQREEVVEARENELAEYIRSIQR